MSYMNSSHTPGPWVADPTQHPRGHIVTARYGSYDIAVVRDASGLPENAANARLVAAAPDLLFELDGLVAFSDGFGLYGENPAAVELRKWIAGARKAIAKATGEAA